MATKGANMDYPIIEWQESQVLEYISKILANSDRFINRITLSSGKDVYLVPEDFYALARKLLRESGALDDEI